MSFSTSDINELHVNNIYMSGQLFGSSATKATVLVSVYQDSNNNVVANTGSTLSLIKIDSQVTMYLSTNTNDVNYVLNDAQTTYSFRTTTGGNTVVIPVGFRPKTQAPFGVPYLKGAGQIGIVLIGDGGTINLTNLDGGAIGAGNQAVFPGAFSYSWDVNV